VCVCVCVCVCDREGLRADKKHEKKCVVCVYMTVRKEESKEGCVSMSEREREGM